MQAKVERHPLNDTLDSALNKMDNQEFSIAISSLDYIKSRP